MGLRKKKDYPTCQLPNNPLCSDLKESGEWYEFC